MKQSRRIAIDIATNVFSDQVLSFTVTARKKPEFISTTRYDQ